jgi:hypothetical protein
MRTRRCSIAAMLTLALALGVSPAVAADVATGGDVISVTAAAQVLNVASGAARGRLDGEVRLRYPGFEQTTVVYTKNHLVLVTMEAVREPNKAPVQCSCSSYELRADGPPVLVTDLRRLTDYSNGERACNHPKAAADDNGNIVWGYGSDYNSPRPNTYAGILNERCDVLSAPQMVNIARDANDGAFDIAHLGDGNFIAGYYSDGGGDVLGFPGPGGDYSVAMGLAVRPGALLPTLERTWITPVVTPTNIGRPTIAAVAPDRGLLCAPKGPNRPSDHIECGLLDTTTGTVLWKAEVVRGDREKRIYYNQPTIAKLSDDRFALLAIESNGQGKMTNNVKGSNLAHLFMLDRTGDAFTVSSETVGAAAHQTHSSICTGAYGESGAPTVAVFSAPPTGVGRAAMLMVGYDDGAKAFNYDAAGDLWPAAWYADSGYLANLYGRNPMRQGRDYMRCIGNVPNPGYHVPNGYMADVKTLFVGAVHGRVPGDFKNSLFLALVPGQMDKKPAPENPVPAGEANPIADGTPPPTAAGGSGDATNCSVSAPGERSPGGLGLAASALAFALVVSRRRKR